MSRKQIAILGSTGSIGCSTLDVISHLGDQCQAVALSGHRQTKKLIEQTRQYRPSAVAVTDPESCDQCRHELKALGTQVYSGPSGMVDLVRRDDVNMVLAAVVGAAGLPAVLEATRAGKTICLANKESLVVAGSLLIPEARKRGVTLLPVDSEHSAIFQCLTAGRLSEVKRVILTASGGPFRNCTRQQMAQATLEDALAHPTWRMGSKITIDSATMFNKALELIEACWLFDLPPEKIQIVIHPESIIHSMVEYVDGSVLAQLSPPDMRTPIQYAITHPDRLEGVSRKLDITQAFSLNFEPADFDRFPSLKLAYEVAAMGGTAGAVLNAANETAVTAFMDGKISFGEISEVVAGTIRLHRLQAEPTLDDLLQADAWARETASAFIRSENKLVRNN